MSMKLSEVKAKVKEARVEWDGEVVDFGYHPGATTPELLEKITSAVSGEGEDVKVIAMLLEPILAWWDVLGDDDQRLPTDAATINLIPVPFLVKIVQQVQGDLRPPESKG